MGNIGGFFKKPCFLSKAASYKASAEQRRVFIKNREIRARLRKNYDVSNVDMCKMCNNNNYPILVIPRS